MNATRLYKQGRTLFKRAHSQFLKRTKVQFNQCVAREGLTPNAFTITHFEESFNGHRVYCSRSRWRRLFQDKAFKLAFGPKCRQALTIVVAHHLRFESNEHDIGVLAVRLDHLVHFRRDADGALILEHRIHDESLARCVQLLKQPSLDEPVDLQPRIFNPNVLLEHLRAILHSPTPKKYTHHMRIWKEPAREAVLGLLSRWGGTALCEVAVDYTSHTQNERPFWSSFFREHGYSDNRFLLRAQFTNSPFIERTLIRLKDAIWRAVPATEHGVLVKLVGYLADRFKHDEPYEIWDALTVRLRHPLETLADEFALESKLRAVLHPGVRFELEFSVSVQNDPRDILPIEDFEFDGLWVFYCDDEEHLTVTTHIDDDIFDEFLGVAGELRGHLGSFTDEDSYFDEEWES